MKLSQNPRILLYLAAISLSIIFIAVHGVNYGIDIQGGSSLQLQLEGAIVELNVDSSRAAVQYQFCSNAERRIRCNRQWRRFNRSVKQIGLFWLKGGGEK